MKRIKELVPGALDNFNAYYDTRYKNGEHVFEDNALSTCIEYFNDYLAPCTVIELMEVKDE